MVDLDSGTHYDLFKLHHPQDREGLSSFQLSSREGVRSSFRVALFDPTSWEGGEWNDFGFMTCSICCRNIVLLHLSNRLLGPFDNHMGY